MKRTIEIDDTLNERVQSAINDVKDFLITYCNDNNSDSLPDLNNDLDYDGTIHEIIDGSVPVYNGEISDLWYLYKSEFEEAYENAGIGNNPLENYGMSAIYCYIQEKINEWYESNAEKVFQSWFEQKQVEEEQEEEEQEEEK